MEVLKNHEQIDTYLNIFQDLKTEPVNMDLEIRCRDETVVTSTLLLVLSSGYLKDILSGVPNNYCIYLKDFNGFMVRKLIEFLSSGVMFCNDDVGEFHELIRNLGIKARDITVEEIKQEFLDSEIFIDEESYEDMESDENNYTELNDKHEGDCTEFCDQSEKESPKRYLNQEIFIDERSYEDIDNYTELSAKYEGDCTVPLDITKNNGNSDENIVTEFCEQSENELPNQHVARQYGSLRYKFECDVCQRTFQNVQIMLTHKLVHLSNSERRKFICGKCGYTAVSEDRLRSHKQSHPLSKRYHCDKCDKSFWKRAGLENHISDDCNNEEGQPYKCEKCERSFNNKANRARHYAVVHVPSYNYQCKICSLSYRTLIGVKYHLISHCNSEPFYCGVCNAKFQYKENGYRHMKAIHPNEKNVGVKCNKETQELENTAIIRLNTVTKLQKPA